MPVAEDPDAVIAGHRYFPPAGGSEPIKLVGAGMPAQSGDGPPVGASRRRVAGQNAPWAWRHRFQRVGGLLCTKNRIEQVADGATIIPAPAQVHCHRLVAVYTLARTRRPQQRLEPIAALHALRELVHGLRLIAAHVVARGKL